MTRRLDADRAALAATVGCVLLFGLLLLLVPAYSVGFDEAKYLGVGANVWAGNGPRTVFGGLFLLHSPLWMTVVVAPEALLGVDAVSWGHLLNGIAGMAVIGLAGVMGWWSRPAAGAIAAAAVLAFVYLFDLSRTTRLDVPAAALAMLYVVVGWRAVRSGTVRWSVAAGLVFAVAVLVKEVALPLAAAPFLAGIVGGVEWRRLFRSTAWVTLFAVLGLAPWFAYYAANTGRVYRIESPAWTLGVLVVPVLLVIVACLAADRLARRPGAAAAVARARARVAPRLLRHGRTLLGWGLTLAWSGAFLFFFSRISRLKGAFILEPGQLLFYAREWLAIAPFVLFIVSGVVLAVLLLAFDPRARERRGVQTALVATVCGAPLVIMVAAVGEPPRNYIAQVGIGAALAAGAWTWALGLLASRVRAAGRPRLADAVLPGAVVLALALGAGAVSVEAWRTRAISSEVRDAAIETTVSWVRANVPKGTPLAFGSFLSYEMGYELVGDYPLSQVRHRMSTFDPSYPLGFRREGDPPSDDWVAADAAPRNVNEYQAYRAAWVEKDLRRRKVGYWIYTTGVDTSSPAIRPQLTPDHGFETVASWDFGEGSRQYTVTIYRVDLPRVALDPSRLYIDPIALQRVVAELEGAPEEDARRVAAALLERIVIEPASAAAEAEADLARLRQLAGGP